MAPFGEMLGENPYPRLKLHWLLKLQWLAAASVAGVLPSRRACASPQRLLHATIFPSAETVHHTSVRMRFPLRANRSSLRRSRAAEPSCARCQTVRSANDADDNRTVL